MRIHKCQERCWIGCSLVLAMAILTLFPHVAWAQVYFYEHSAIPSGGGPAAIVLGDFIGDHKSDLAVSNSYDNTVSILLGGANGAFRAKVDYPTGKVPTFLVVADFNGDKKLDLAVINQSDNTVSILLGKGNGTFRPHVDYAVGSLPVGIVAADFNQDGKQDLAVVNENDNTVSILLGKGDGTFQAQTLVTVGTEPTSLSSGDFNSDGKVDLISANNTGTLNVLLSKGDGTFTRVDTTIGVSGPAFSALAVGDFDRDHKLDTVVSSIMGPLVYLRGKGDGTFESPVPIGTSAPDRVRFILAGDFNHDGKLDLVEHGTAGMWLLPGNGDGTFRQPVVSPLAALNDADTFTSADINGDGEPDLLLTNQNLDEIDILLGNGDGTLATMRKVSSGQTAYSPDAAIVADFNGDGKLDIAVAETNFPHGQISVQLGKGTGAFGTPVISPLASSAINNSDMMMLGDFNGDSKADLLVLDDYGKGFQALLGKGNGSFQAPVDNVVTYTILSLGVGDLNGDGKADVVVTANGSGTGAMNVYLSNGDGTFQAGAQYAVPLYSAVAVADVNHDGKQDIILTGFGEPLLVFLGNGDGSFQKPISGPTAIYSGGMVLKDLNGDGKVDLAIGTYNGIGFLAGNGDGTFQNPVYSNSAFSFLGRMLAGDFNGDGKLDLVTYPPGNTTLSGAVVMMGRGDGTFGPQLAFGQSGPWPVDLVVGDFNQDHVDDLGMPTQDLLSGASVVNLYLSGPAINVFPVALDFGVETVGQTSSPKAITLTNAGNSRLNIAKLTLTGEYLLQQNNCARGLALRQSCTIQISFSPTVKGNGHGDLSIFDNLHGSPQKVSLSGVGK